VGCAFRSASRFFARRGLGLRIERAASAVIARSVSDDANQNPNDQLEFFALLAMTSESNSLAELDSGGIRFARAYLMLTMDQQKPPQ
jgi:hypothetical protein